LPGLISCLDGEKFTGFGRVCRAPFQGSGQATDPSDGSRDGVSVLWLKAPADVLREWF